MSPAPIFVNESGRHWYTALNAHRHFAATVPGTSRVWTNCDRVFVGMKRHLPFVRQDFARIRADIYPIRLWTVAVFLAGAMPLLRKRGIARIAIGDEYDTSRRVTSNNVTHYDGLYDQSRWFDNALTRYFHRKGWGITVFSPLRQLSELLIQKTLVERYPDLQRHQMSCHAHRRGSRAAVQALPRMSADRGTLRHRRRSRCGSPRARSIACVRCRSSPKQGSRDRAAHVGASAVQARGQARQRAATSKCCNCVDAERPVEGCPRTRAPAPESLAGGGATSA